MANESYAIAGGEAGRERLRVVARVFGSGTANILDAAGVGEGMACLDVGSGGGDVSRELAGRVGPTGSVLGIDLDTVKVDIARKEAAARDLGNVAFQVGDVFDLDHQCDFDFVYARFLLTHLKDPGAAVERMAQALRPGGTIAIEDIDFTGHFSNPECPPFQDYIGLYTQVVQGKGGDPNIGPRLPQLLRQAGLGNIAMTVSQPADIRGETKLINPITMDCIGESVVAAGLASKAEVSRIVDDLFAVAQDEETVLSTPRIVQVWARKA